MRRRSAITSGRFAATLMVMWLLPEAFATEFAASSTRRVTSVGSRTRGRVPVSIRANSRSSPIRSRIRLACASIMRTSWVASAASRTGSDSSSVAAEPLTATSGARSSSLTRPKKSARSRSSSSSDVMSCMVTTTDSTLPSSERTGVALISTVIDCPPGRARTICSARAVSPVPRACARGTSASETSRPSARRTVMSFSRSAADSSGPCSSTDDAHRFAIGPHGGASRRVEHQHPDRGGVDQGLKVRPGSPLVPVAARVRDDQSRLRGERRQGHIVLVAEFGARRTLSQVDRPHRLAFAADRRRQTRTDLDGGAELPQPLRPEIGGHIRDPQRFFEPTEVLEEPQTPGKLGEQPVLLGSHARGDESLKPTRPVDDADTAEACAGQFTSAVDDDLQHAVELQALVDAQAGLAQPPQPLVKCTDPCL